MFTRKSESKGSWGKTCSPSNRKLLGNEKHVEKKCEGLGGPTIFVRPMCESWVLPLFAAFFMCEMELHESSTYNGNGGSAPHGPTCYHHFILVFRLRWYTGTRYTCFIKFHHQNIYIHSLKLQQFAPEKWRSLVGGLRRHVPLEVSNVGVTFKNPPPPPRIFFWGGAVLFWVAIVISEMILCSSAIAGSICGWFAAFGFCCDPPVLVVLAVLLY